MSLSKSHLKVPLKSAKSKAEKLAEGHDKVEKSLPQSKTRPRITRVISIANVQLIGNGTDRSMNGVVVAGSIYYYYSGRRVLCRLGALGNRRVNP